MRRQTKVHPRHDKSVGRVALEKTVAVAEAQGAVVEGPETLALDIEGLDQHDGFADILPVGADILYRGSADRTGNSRETLQTLLVFEDARQNECMPRNTRPYTEPVRIAPGRFDALEADLEHEPREASIGDDDVA